jgi:cytochrome c-type biogenesis protein CcmH/NrfG
METRLERFCNRLIEAGWLLAVVLIPTFINVKTNRVFEADKGMLVRSLALLMTAVWLIKIAERAIHWLGSLLGLLDRTNPTRLRRPWLFYVMVLLFIVFAIVYLGSTLLSVHPRISLMGSYQRGQGTYFTLCLIAIALLIATHLRSHAQLGRLLAAVALGSLPVTIYTIVQAIGADPLLWGGPQAVVASTAGNANFLAAYLVMVIPLTATGLITLTLVIWQAIKSCREAMTKAPSILHIITYSLFLICGLPILGLQVYALSLSNALIAALALLVAAVPFVLFLIATLPRRPLPRRIIVGLVILSITGILVPLVVVSFTDIPLAESPVAQWAEASQSPTIVVRQLLAEGARELLYTRPSIGNQPDGWVSLRPLLGYGPETIFFTYNPVYQPELGHYEARTSSPDRTYNQLLDVGVNLGWIGTAVFLLILLALPSAAITTLLAAPRTIKALVAGGVLWMGLAHFVEAQFNIPTISTRLFFWIGLGTVAALVGRCKEPQKPNAGFVTPSLASGVALFLLPTTALLATSVAGFLHIVQDGIVPSIIAVIGLLLALAAFVANLTLSHRKPEKSSTRQWFHLGTTGLLVALTLTLLIGASVTTAVLASRAKLPFQSFPTSLDDILLQVKLFPVMAFGTVLVGLPSVALALAPSLAPTKPWNWRNLVASTLGLPLHILVAAGALALIAITCVKPMQADAVYKTTLALEPSSPESAIEAYKHTIALAPSEDFYYFELGRVLLSQIPTKGKTGLAEAFEAFENAYALNPINLDHLRGLIATHSVAAALETDPKVQKTHLDAANDAYVQALDLAPQNVVLWNQWAVFQVEALHDTEEACQLLEHSLALDPEFEQTQQLYASICP